MTWKETRSVSTDSICTLAQQEGYSNWHEDCGEAWFCAQGADEGIGASTLHLSKSEVPPGSQASRDAHSNSRELRDRAENSISRDVILQRDHRQNPCCDNPAQTLLP